MYEHLLLLKVSAVAKVDALKAQWPRGLRDCSITKKVIDSLTDFYISSNFFCQSVLYQDTEPIPTKLLWGKLDIRLSKLPETVHSLLH